MTTPTTIHGLCEKRFEPLLDAFRANFDDGFELGASLAVTHRGKMVVDLWAGHADEEHSRPWERDTIVAVASTTKIAATISILMLVDRGLIDLDTTVAHYWPEFAQGGKEAVTVRDALTHQAGVPGFVPPVARQTLLEWTAVTERLAAEPHWFAGERRVVYHAATYGLLIGELIRRVDGRRPAQFFHEEIALKSGNDFQVALTPRSDLARLARVRWAPRPTTSSPPSNASSSEDLAARVRDADIFRSPEVWQSWELQAHENPSSTGRAQRPLDRAHVRHSRHGW